MQDRAAKWVYAVLKQFWLLAYIEVSPIWQIIYYCWILPFSLRLRWEDNIKINLDEVGRYLTSPMTQWSNLTGPTLLPKTRNKSNFKFLKGFLYFFCIFYFWHSGQWEKSKSYPVVNKQTTFWNLLRLWTLFITHFSIHFEH